ncbi:MAG: TonB family protein [Sulfuricurvum sp.]
MLKKSLALSAVLHLMVIMALGFWMNHTKQSPKPKPIVVTMVALPSPPTLTQKVTQSKPPPPAVIPQTIPLSPVTTSHTLPNIVAKAQPTVPSVATVTKPVEATLPPAPPKPSQVDTASIKNQYLGYLRQNVEDHKNYPKNAKRLGQTGTVEVTFTVMADGTITNVKVRQSSNFTLLDTAAKEILTALAKVRPIPKELGKDAWEITLPISYIIE